MTIRMTNMTMNPNLTNLRAGNILELSRSGLIEALGLFLPTMAVETFFAIHLDFKIKATEIS